VTFVAHTYKGDTVTSSIDTSSAVRAGGTERRTRQHLRDVFENAYRVAYPLLDSGQVLSGAGSAHFLRIVLHDAFPELQLQDIAILSVAIERVFRERSKSGNQ
jgi:hypothetical protein